MNNNLTNLFDWFLWGSSIFMIALFAHQAWANLVRVKVSRFSIDALLVWFFLKFGTENARQGIMAFKKDASRIRLLGFYALMVVVGGIYQLIDRW